jgi:hypothetical protein
MMVVDCSKCVHNGPCTTLTKQKAERSGQCLGFKENTKPPRRGRG